jgi:hypothetical protein
MRCRMPDGAVASRFAHGCVRGAWVLARGAGVLALLFVFSSAAVATTACQPSRPSDARDYWSWRLIDGRQCWYQGQPGRSKATLFWSVEQPPPAEPEVEQPEQVAMADGERALLESYWPDLDTLPVVFPTDRWWPRDIVIVDMTRGPPATRSSGHEGAIATLLMILAAVCLVCLALVLLKRRMLDGEVVLRAAPAASTTGCQSKGANGAVSRLNTAAIRLTAGAISLSTSTHLLPMLNWKLVKPVSLPPGRARFGTKPLPTGSVTYTNTIGGVRFKGRSPATTGVATARIRSRARPTRSLAWAGRRLASGTKQ